MTWIWHDQFILQALRRLGDDEFDSTRIIERQLSFNGGRPTKLIAFRDATALVMVLKGKIAQKTRQQFADIINRYMAGDLTLVSEIQANALSSSPVAQLARQSLDIEDEVGRKRRREDLELEQLQLNIAERKKALEDSTKQSTITHINSVMDVMQNLDPNWKQDERLVVQLKDMIVNVTTGQKAITNGDNTPVYISYVAMQLGFKKLTHSDLCKIGQKAVALYRARYNKDPLKRKEHVNGKEQQVNDYTERDRDLLEEAIVSVMRK